MPLARPYSPTSVVPPSPPVPGPGAPAPTPWHPISRWGGRPRGSRAAGPQRGSLRGPPGASKALPLAVALSGSEVSCEESLRFAGSALRLALRLAVRQLHCCKCHSGHRLGTLPHMLPLLLLLLSVAGAASSAANPYLFTVDASQSSPPLELNFPVLDCVGSGHGALALRADYRDHLTRVQRDIGFKHIRGHGLLDDDMSSLICYWTNQFSALQRLTRAQVDRSLFLMHHSRPCLCPSPSWPVTLSRFA